MFKKAITRQPTLTEGCIIRHRYHGEWEYALWHKDHSFTVLMWQRTLNETRNGTPLPDAFETYGFKLSPAEKEFSDRMKKIKLQIIQGCPVIQCVWKNGAWVARKEVTP